ncbi:MAG: hypothetical protein KIT84_13120 [Labilithrix sp.]|nr:hypothetical protein [Labilithrix sp.]MCW5811957.1 hypothetical protein [Labilithrix sp.]
MAPRGAITDVVVVLKGSSEPLPFDPRGGRLTKVTSDVAQLVGHPIVLELDTALSPELSASLEESVLASFETIVRELVLLQKEDPAMFAKARGIERVACRYDAVARDTEGELTSGGKVLSVRSPPDRFPLLARHVLVDAVYTAYIGDLDARFGDADPTRLPARERGAYFDYMTSSRPGRGYLWIAARRRGENDAQLREEHLARLLRFAGAVDAKSDLGVKARRWLLSELQYVGVGTRAYVAWLDQNAATFSDEEKLTLAKKVFDRRDAAALPGFDATSFGFAVYDQWAAGKVHGDLEKVVVCPQKRRGEAETEIHYGCSGFFESLFKTDAGRDALARRAASDARLLEVALLNLGHGQGKEAVAFMNLLARTEQSFHEAGRILFHDYARRDDVRDALEAAAPAWWRDLPKQRGFALLVMARRNEQLHPHYADGQWTRWTAEFGGAVKGDVLASFLAEGPRAVEMVPNMWLAFAKGAERDELVARSLPLLLDRDRAARTSRATAPLALLRTRLCAEKSAASLATMRTALDRWTKDHPDAPSAVSNAVADYQLPRCTKEQARDR